MHQGCMVLAGIRPCWAHKKYHQTDAFKAYQKKYHQTDDYKEYQKAYQKAYRQTDAFKASQKKAYQKRKALAASLPGNAAS